MPGWARRDLSLSISKAKSCGGVSWQADHVWGYGSSPILHGGLVILNFGPGDPSFLVAMDAAERKTELES